MAAVLALMLVPAILLFVLAFGTMITEPSFTTVFSMGFLLALCTGAILGLFRWAQEMDHAGDAEA